MATGCGSRDGVVCRCEAAKTGMDPIGMLADRTGGGVGCFAAVVARAAAGFGGSMTGAGRSLTSCNEDPVISQVSESDCWKLDAGDIGTSSSDNEEVAGTPTSGKSSNSRMSSIACGSKWTATSS